MSYCYDSPRISGISEKGAKTSVTDVAPRTKGQMHRTPTIDFLVVHRGTITLHLEGDERVTVKEGEAVGELGCELDRESIMPAYMTFRLTASSACDNARMGERDG